MKRDGGRSVRGGLAAAAMTMAAGCVGGAADPGDLDRAPPVAATQAALERGSQRHDQDRGRGGDHDRDRDHDHDHDRDRDRDRDCRRPARGTPAALAIPGDACLEVKARGWGQQIYTCSGGAWLLKAPEANLLDERGRYVGNHFLGPTWQWRDGSKLAAARVAQVAAPAASQDIPWLLLSVASADGDGELAGVKYIQRLDTVGGVAPAGACSDGAETRISYAADYLFFRPRGRGDN